MGKRVAAVFLIFICTSVAWVILGGTIMIRSESSESALSNRVASTWGSPQRQVPPVASYIVKVPTEITGIENGQKFVRTGERDERHVLPIDASRIAVRIELEPRKKGLRWYSTYRVAFAGTYTFRNTGPAGKIDFRVPFPASQALYDDLAVTVNRIPVALTGTGGGGDPKGPAAAVTGTATVAPGETAVLEVRYRSQGLGSWRYGFGEQVSQVKDFALSMTTNFTDIDFPDNTLSPTAKRKTGGGWDLAWAYQSLVSGYDVAMAMPEKLQPGELAGRISFFAPVSLFFFFFVMLLITTLRRIELHPVNYFFLAAAFFAFHLLLAYLVDHIDIHLAFIISSLVSLGLVVSYLRLVIGMRFAAVEAGLTQFLYLVLFSYAFFFKGFTGLAITIGSILTLFVAMQLTGRIRWKERLAAKPA